MIVSERAAYLGRHPRNKMMALASQYPDIIAMGRGDPDLPTAPHIIEAAFKAAREGATHYTPIRGIPPLLEAICGKLQRENSVSYTPDEILVTTGGQEAINIILHTLINPGDEVIFPSPVYASYELAAHLAGARVVRVPLDKDDGFALRPDQIEAAITPRTKAIAIISPNNPTGTVFPAGVLGQIAEVAARHNVMVISDEIYDRVLFDGYEHCSIAGFPGMKERTVIVNGVSKAYAMTGWRVGWIAAPAALARAMEVVKHTFSICTPAPNQHAALAAYTGPQDCVAEAIATYSRRRAWLLEALKSAGLTTAPHGGSIFVFPDIRPTGLTSEAFCLGLLEQERVVVYPGSEFGPDGEGFLRMSLLTPDAKYKEGVERLARYARGILHANPVQ